MSWEWLDRLADIESQATHGDRRFRVYRWRPTAQVQTPCVYNALLPGRTEKIDECTIRDTIRLEIVMLARHTEGGVDMGRLEAYFDELRPLLDAELYTTGRDPLGLRTARRTGSLAVREIFNEINYPGLAIQLELHVDHLVNV